MILIIFLLLIAVICIMYKREPFEQHVYNSNELYTHLSFISSILTKHDIKHWIMYGTLLGAVRENNIIPYDKNTIEGEI